MNKTSTPSISNDQLRTLLRLVLRDVRPQQPSSAVLKAIRTAARS